MLNLLSFRSDNATKMGYRKRLSCIVELTCLLVLMTGLCVHLAAQEKNVSNSDTRQGEQSNASVANPQVDGSVESNSTSVDPKLLATVIHPQAGLMTMGLRDEEHDACFRILDQIRKADRKDLVQEASNFLDDRLARPDFQKFKDDPTAVFPLYQDIIRYMEEYHGKLIEIRGDVRRLFERTAPKNDQGIEKYYEVWFYTEQSKANPYVVFCTSIPDEMPRGNDLLVTRVSTIGFFFKSFGFEYHDRRRFAPMLISANLEWNHQRRDPIDSDPRIFPPTRRLTTRGIRDDEADPYYRLLRLCAQLEPSTMRKASRHFQELRKSKLYKKYDEFPAFLDLHKHNELYYGKLMTLRGHVRKLIESDASENEYGIKKQYEVWLYTDDSQNNPAVFVCTSIPKDIPTGPDILVDNVSVTGYFFKNFGFKAQDNWRFAPMLIGARVRWDVAQARTPLFTAPVLYGMVVGVAALLIAIAVVATRRDRKYRQTKIMPQLSGDLTSFDTAVKAESNSDNATSGQSDTTVEIQTSDLNNSESTVADDSE